MQVILESYNMCFEFIYSKKKDKKNKALSDALIPIEEQEPRCGLCSQHNELLILSCKHTLCKGCIETQKLYSYYPCFLCKNITWVNVVSKVE